VSSGAHVRMIQKESQVMDGDRIVLKEPRFHGVASKQSHKTMSRIKGKETRPELALRRALWQKGIRYRKNLKSLPGCPDIVITRYKIAIFVDSEFFHGKDWGQKKAKVQNGANSDYWSAKIERNIVRDREKEAGLRALGYRIIRFWSKDAIKDTDSCVRAIEEAIFERKTGGECDGVYEPYEPTTLMPTKP